MGSGIPRHCGDPGAAGAPSWGSDRAEGHREGVAEALRVPGRLADDAHALHDGRHFLTVHFDTGRLFRIDSRTRAIRDVDLAGVARRTGDGMMLSGRTLLVVREEPGEMVPVRLSDDLRSGRIGAPFGRDRLDFPTTVALRGDRVLVVNSQLDRAPDRGSPPFTVSTLRPPDEVLFSPSEGV